MHVTMGGFSRGNSHCNEVATATAVRLEGQQGGWTGGARQVGEEVKGSLAGHALKFIIQSQRETAALVSDSAQPCGLRLEGVRVGCADPQVGVACVFRVPVTTGGQVGGKMLRTWI